MMARSEQSNAVASAPPRATIGAGNGQRIDIQALRGIAVSMVVLYHAELGLFRAGYLGVDIFFVVSGFLITGLIERALSRGTFRFADFYARRVRRLLPAAYVVLAATTLAAFVLLTAVQYRDYVAQLIGSLAFSNNLVLWSQTGYFSPDAAFRPLLHMWSLAIEEQYYLLVPLALWMLPRRLTLSGLALATLASLALCLWMVGSRPGAAFFLLPTRAWELGFGSVAAMISHHAWVRAAARVLLLPAVTLIVAIPVFPLPGQSPGINAVLVCTATAVAILAASTRADGWLATRALAKIGDISYSLYLVHWPLFALSRVAYLTNALPLALTLALVAAALALAALLYRFVEQPLRRAPVDGWRLASVAIAASLVVAALGIGLGQVKAGRSGDNITPLLPVAGLPGAACFAEAPRTFNGSCAEPGGPPELMVWGDSFSSHIVPGIAATTDRRIVQASMGHCAPFANYAAVVTANERAFSEGCLAFNASVLDYLKRTPSIRVVVLVGQYYRSLGDISVAAIARGPDGDVIDQPLGMARTVAAQAETVRAIRALNLSAVVFAPPPPADFDRGACWARQVERLPTWGRLASCIVDEARIAPVRQRNDALMVAFVRVGKTPVLDPRGALCDERRCQTIDRGVPLYRDTDHFSRAGAVEVGRRMRLGDAAWAAAR